MIDGWRVVSDGKSDIRVHLLTHTATIPSLFHPTLEIRFKETV
jgi:hypothetical protein